MDIRIDSAKEEALTAIVHRHPVVPALLSHRQVAKMESTFGKAFLNHVHPVTGRIHGDYRQIGAATGRMACSNPNLQQIPRGQVYRAAFRPEQGRVLVKADFSQIELRIAAELSGDAEMLDAFRRGDDLHSVTARAVLGREPGKDDRQLAKALNFGLLYGMGPGRLISYAKNGFGVELTPSAAAAFQRKFFEAYPGLAAWHRRQGNSPIETRTLSGRRRCDVAVFTEKLNSPIQGTGADILKIALARLYQDRIAVPSALPVLVVHDEIVIEVDIDEADAAKAWLVGHMQAAAAAVLKGVPVVVDAAVVADWSGAEVDERTAPELCEAA